MRWFLLVLFIYPGLMVFAGHKPQIQLVNQNEKGCIVQYQGGEWSGTRGGEKGMVIRLDQSTGLMQKGFPDLPKLTFSLSIPQGKKAVVTLSDLQYTDVANIMVAPSKGHILRDINPATVPYEFGDVYHVDAFFPQQLYSLPPSYVFRNIVGQNIHIQPVQYNPVSNIMRVYNSMKLNVAFVDDLNAPQLSSTGHTPIEPILDRHFLNYSVQKPLYTPMKQFGSMLIVCPPNYINAMQSFIEWKRQKGMKVYVVSTDTIPNGVSNSSIHELAKWYYENMDIVYMLLVGDNADIPGYEGNLNGMIIFGLSDMAYAYVTGNDHYPEFIVGRFSGEKETDIQIQAQRTMLYEKYPNVNGDWFQQQIGIASEQGDAGSDDGQLDYEHMCDILDSNKNQYYYLDHQGYFEGSQILCNDASGHPSPTDIVNAFNAGIGLLNYCGHGTIEQFTTSAFSTLEVMDLTNSEGNWPFIFDVACYNGTFKGYTCLGESLLRAKNSQGKPTGALAAVMSSILQYWNPPMQGQDEMNAVLRNARSNNTSTSYGPIVLSGLMSTMEQYNTAIDPDDGNQTADTWIIFGDPSVEVRTKNEGQLNCIHSGWMQKNSWDFFIACNTEGARISLYYQGDVLASALVHNGVAHLIFNPVTVLDSITVTATKQNWQPYFGHIDVVEFPTSSAGVQTTTVNIYPVPTQDQLHVDWQREEGYKTLEVIDMTGRILQTHQTRSNSIELNTSQLSHGRYMIRLSGVHQRVLSFVK